ncbi:hypothetical protein D3C78_1573450 [compost metagenome]
MAPFDSAFLAMSLSLKAGVKTPPAMAVRLIAFFATLAAAVVRRIVRVQLVGAIVLGSLVGRIVGVGLVGVMVLLAHGGAPLGGWRLQPKNALGAEKLFCVEAAKNTCTRRQTHESPPAGCRSARALSW